MLFPPYTAVREWLPATKPLVTREPLPCPSVAVPSVVKPSLKVIVPDALLGITVAVRVTPEPEVDGLRLEVRAVAVAALLTVSVRVVEVEVE